MNIKNIFLIASALSILSTTTTSGQEGPKVLNPTNFGLVIPQEPSTLPRSRVEMIAPQPKAKKQAKSTLIPTDNQTWKIADGWELAQNDLIVTSPNSIFSHQLNTDKWYNATVPGTVLTTLVEQGVYPDPYFGMNNMAIPEWLCRTDWWYRTVFELPKDKGQNKIWLQFNGINYKADVWLNGKLLGKINGAFTRGVFDITELISSKNILAVHIYPPHNPGIPHEQSPTSGRGPNGGQLALDGPTFISSEGWDWIPGIRDRNIGIWQDVEIKYTGEITLGDAQIITDLPLPETSSAEIEIKSEVTNHASAQRTITLNGEIENIKFSKEVTLAPGQTTQVSFNVGEFAQLKINNPRLWWPNGYGAQEFYKLKLNLLSDNNISDSKDIRFGIRELSYQMSIDTPTAKEQRVEFNPTSALKAKKPLFDNYYRRDLGNGTSITRLRKGVDESLLQIIEKDGTEPYLVFKVNGVRIFCKGGNWGMDDGMKRVSRERLEPYFQLHKDANFNMIRNWTGESTEEMFYELCDEYGMLVWNDFWISTEGSNLNVNDEDLFMANATDVVKRFRNHPSLALWCPRNEGYATPTLEPRLSNLIAEEDGTRHYNPNSRTLNLRPSGPWHYYRDGANYFRHDAKGFNSELGTPAVPTAASMRKMMAKEDLWPISDAWYYHDLHFGQIDYRKAIDSLYGKAIDLDDFCKKAQMVNYDSHRAMFEAWNSKLWNSTSGVLLWMTHCAWPSVMWQVYSWDYETFAAYFGCMKACEPIHIQMNQDDNKVVAVNTSRTAYAKAKATLAFYDLSGKLLSKKEVDLASIPANQLTECFTAQLPNTSEPYLARVTLSSAGKLLSINDYIKTSADDYQSLNSLPIATLRGVVKSAKQQAKQEINVEVYNPSKAVAVSVKLNLRDAASGEIILPAYFSDGYFNLLPGEKRVVTATFDYANKVVVSADGYNIANITIAQ